MDLERLQQLLDKKAAQYNSDAFIADDPVSIPHRFSLPQDIEIAGFFAAVLAWGNRKAIINNSRKLLQLMDNAPHQFVLYFQENDLRPLMHFAHRTFNGTDACYFLHFLQRHYKQYNSLESAFFFQANVENPVEEGLNAFRRYFFDSEYAPERTRKHIAAPERGSACKRLNMFLRWMIRKDDAGVDFGLWSGVMPSELICPLDVHVSRIARSVGLLSRKQNDWKAALELTRALRLFDPEDPVKYDYALFGMGVMEKF